MISNIPKPDTYKKDYLEAASRVRVNIIQKDSLPEFKPIKKSIAKEVSSQIKIKIPTVRIPTIKITKPPKTKNKAKKVKPIDKTLWRENFDQMQHLRNISREN